MIVSGFIEVPISLSLRETCSFASFLLLSFGFSFRHLQKNQDTALRICSWDGCLPAGNVISFERSPWKLWPTLNKFGEILQNPAFHCWLDFWSHSVFQAGFKPKSIWAVLVVGTKQCNKSSIKTVPSHSHELKHAGACPSLVKKGGEAVNGPLEGFMLCRRKNKEKVRKIKNSKSQYCNLEEKPSALWMMQKCSGALNDASNKLN